MGIYGESYEGKPSTSRSIYATPSDDTLDVGLPRFGTEDPYARSEEFQNILWRAKQFGLDRLTPGEQKQLQSARENYPEVNEWMNSLGRKQEEPEEEDDQNVLKEYWEGLKPNLEQLPAHLSNLWNSFKEADNRFTAWAKSETEWPEFDYSIGQPELIEELIQNPEKADALGRAMFESTAKGLASFVPEMAEHFWNDTKKYGAVTAAVRLGAGLFRFPFQVGTDAFNMFGAGIEPSTQIGDVPIEEIQAPTSQEVVEQYKQDPTPIVFVALPIIKGYRAYAAKKARYAEIKESVEISERVLLEDYQRLQKLADEQLADAKPGKKIGEKPTVPETADPQIQRIKETPAGQLMTEAMQVQDKYSAKEVAELYALDREFVENIVSGERVGKKPPEPKAIVEITREKFGAGEKVVEPKVAEKPVEKPATEASPKNLPKISQEKGTEIAREAKPAVETEAVKSQKAKIAEIEADISERQRWIDELGESQDPNAKEFKFSAQAQLAEKEARLADAKSELERLKKEPPPEPEPPEPSVPAKPIQEGGITGQTPIKKSEGIKPPAKPIQEGGITGQTPIKKSEGIKPPEKEVSSEINDKSTKTPPETAKLEGAEVEKPKLSDAEIGFAERGMKSVKNIQALPEVFQPREDAFAKDTYNRLNESYNAGKMDDVVIWRVPEDIPKDHPFYNKLKDKVGQDIAITHSRYEFLKDKAAQGKLKTGEDIPYRRFEGTLDEAIEYAQTSNLQGTNQTLVENLRLYRNLRERGNSPEDIGKKVNIDSKLLGDYDAWSHLNPKGEFMRYIAQEAQGSGEGINRIKNFGRWVGELRRDYPELTNQHELQIFDWLYREKGEHWKINKEPFMNKIDRFVKDMEFDPSKPLRFKAEEELRTKTKGTPNGRELLKKLDELERRYDVAQHPGEKELLMKQVSDLKKKIKEIIDREQTSLFGTEDIITPEEKRGGGLGAINPFTDLKQKYASALKAAEAKRNRGLDDMGAGPSIIIQRAPKDVGITTAVRTPSNVFGVTPGARVTYGKTAQEAARKILLTNRDIMVEAGNHSELMSNWLSRVAKKDYGRKGEKIYEHITDPSKDKQLAPESLEAVKNIRDFLEERRQEVIKIKRDEVRPAISKLTEREWRRANGRVGKKLTPEEQRKVKDAIDAALREHIPDDWGVDNYLPQMHPGSWHVYVIDLEGAESFIGSAKTPGDVINVAMKWYSDHPEVSPDAFIARGKAVRGDATIRTSKPNFYRIVNEIAEAAEQAVTKDAIAEALRGKIGTRSGKQKFAGFLQKRKGGEGYTRDIRRVLEAYNQTFTRWKHLTALNREVQPMIEAISKERPNTGAAIQGMFDYLWGRSPSQASLLLDASIQKLPGAKNWSRPGVLERWTGYIKRGIVTSFLEYNPRFHLLNSLQTYQTTAPTVTWKEWREGKKFFASEEGKEALRRHGVRHYTAGKYLEGGKKTNLIAEEARNQEIAWAINYKKARNMGFSDAAANDYAFLRGNLYTQFVHLQADTPPILRGPVTSTIGQFRRFQIKDLELGFNLIADKNYPGVAKWLGAKLLIGGARIFTKPIASIPIVGGSIGYLTAEVYNEIEKEHGKTVADGVAFGLPGLIGLDMSYSIMFADMPYGETIPEKIGNVLLGPAGNLVVRTGAAAVDTKGDVGSWTERAGRSATQTIPSLKWIDALGAVYRDLEDGKYVFEDPAGRKKFKTDLKGVIVKAMGGRTTDEGAAEIYAEAITNITEKREQVFDIATRNLIKAYRGEGAFDPTDILDWNELYPEFGIAEKDLIKRTTLRMEGLDRTRLERMIKNSPMGIEYYYRQQTGYFGK